MAFLNFKNTLVSNNLIFYSLLLTGCLYFMSPGREIKSQTLDGTELSEQQVKAAYLYNFAKFVEWPDSAFSSDTDPIQIAIIGDDPFGIILDQIIKNKTLNGRPLLINRFQSMPSDLHFHIVFIGNNDTTQVRSILQQLDSLPVLTVGDMKDFATKGGCINFIFKQNRVLFEINMDASQRAGLKISSRLLRLAILVEEKL